MHWINIQFATQRISHPIPTLHQVHPALTHIALQVPTLAPANAGTHNLHGLTRPAQDSSTHQFEVEH